MRVLIACEYTGSVRDAFLALGHDAMSADLKPSLTPGPHYTGDVFDILVTQYETFDLMVAHPPCTHLAVSGAKHFHRKEKEQADALDFVRRLMSVPIPRIAIENPVSVISSKIRKPDQIIQPWQFGDPYQKTTCLWLKGLPLLQPTNVVDKGEFYVSPSGKRLPKWYSNSRKMRDRTFPGIARAMAEQWGGSTPPPYRGVRR